MTQPPEIPPDLPPEQHEAFLRHHGLATNLREKSAAMYMQGSAAPLLAKHTDADICQTYLERLREDAGVRGDPVEQILVEQLALAHHNLGRLYVKAAESQSIEQAECFNNAAARLLGELRRLVLALREYRSPIIARQVTLVNQQNVAAGDQQIAYLPDRGSAEEKTGVENKLRKGISHDERLETFTGSRAGGCWEAEPIEGQRTYRSGTPEAARVHLAKPSVVEVNGTQDG